MSEVRQFLFLSETQQKAIKGLRLCMCVDVGVVVCGRRKEEERKEEEVGKEA